MLDGRDVNLRVDLGYLLFALRKRAVLSDVQAEVTPHQRREPVVDHDGIVLADGVYLVLPEREDDGCGLVADDRLCQGPRAPNLDSICLFSPTLTILAFTFTCLVDGDKSFTFVNTFSMFSLSHASPSPTL